MMPGVTTSPVASISSAAVTDDRSPIFLMTPPEIPMSAVTGGAPVPSTIVPDRTMRSRPPLANDLPLSLGCPIFSSPSGSSRPWWMRSSVDARDLVRLQATLDRRQPVTRANVDLARAVGQVGKSQNGPSIDEACETRNRQLVRNLQIDQVAVRPLAERDED